jgi:hypothetical protein
MSGVQHKYFEKLSVFFFKFNIEGYGEFFSGITPIYDNYMFIDISWLRHNTSNMGLKLS